MLGAILALGEFPRAEIRAGSAMRLSLAGLTWNRLGRSSRSRLHTPFPGLDALFPCLGAASLIYVGEARGRATSKRLLSSRPLVFVGLISYSLYLWHWPIHVFSKYVSVASQGASESAALIALSFCLAVLSWRYVERPFRRRDVFSRRQIFCIGGAAMAATLLRVGSPVRVSRIAPALLARGSTDFCRSRRRRAAPAWLLQPLARCGASRPGVPDRRHSCFGGDIYSLGRFPC